MSRLIISLQESLATIESGDFSPSNPLPQARGRRALAQSEDPKDHLIASLDERLTNLEEQLDPRRKAVPYVNAQVLYRGKPIPSSGSPYYGMAAVNSLLSYLKAEAFSCGTRPYTGDLSKADEILNRANVVLGSTEIARLAGGLDEILNLQNKDDIIQLAYEVAHFRASDII